MPYLHDPSKKKPTGEMSITSLNRGLSSLVNTFKAQKREQRVALPAAPNDEGIKTYFFAAADIRSGDLKNNWKKYVDYNPDTKNIDIKLNGVVEYTTEYEDGRVEEHYTSKSKTISVSGHLNDVRKTLSIEIS